MSIIKQAYCNDFVVMSNQLAQNNNLSLRARGLMAYMLSLPNHWAIHVNHLVKQMQEGRHIIRTTLDELKKAGYIHHHKKGFNEGWEYYVFSSPHTEEQFKLFLRTVQSSNYSIFEQFEDRPLEKKYSSKKEISSSRSKKPQRAPSSKADRIDDSSKSPKQEVYKGVFLTEKEMRDCKRALVARGLTFPVADAVEFIMRSPGRKRHIMNWANAIQSWSFKPYQTTHVQENENMAKRVEEDFAQNPRPFSAKFVHDKTKDVKGLSFEHKDPRRQKHNQFFAITDGEFQDKVSAFIRSKELNKAHVKVVKPKKIKPLTAIEKKNKQECEKILQDKKGLNWSFEPSKNGKLGVLVYPKYATNPDEFKRIDLDDKALKNKLKEWATRYLSPKTP